MTWVVVAQTCQRVIVMYAGRIVEQAAAIDLFARPAHPYAQGLMHSLPDPRHGRRHRLAEIPGIVPSLREHILGCSFAARCPIATGVCREKVPSLRELEPGHAVARWRAEEVVGV